LISVYLVELLRRSFGNKSAFLKLCLDVLWELVHLTGVHGSPPYIDGMIVRSVRSFLNKVCSYV